MADTFRTDITADPQPFIDALDRAADAAMTDSQRMASSMREAFIAVGAGAQQTAQQVAAHTSSMATGFSAVRRAAEIALAALGGGMLAKFGADAAHAAIATEHLALMLGTTLEKATALKIALGEIGVDTESYTTMVSKMTMKLREGEERFNELGIKTRGANHELLSTDEITQNALQALMRFKAGTDRNLASTELFGRGWNEVVKLMRLTPEAIEEARKKAEELGLAVGPDAVEKAHQYQKVMADLKFAIEGIGKAIGEQMLPRLQKTSQWMTGEGKTAISVAVTLFGGLGNVIGGLARTVSQITTVLGAMFATIATGFQLVADKGFSAKQALAQLKEIAAQMNRDLANPPKPPAPPGGAPGAAPGEGGSGTYTAHDKDRMVKWEAELAAQRNAYDREKLEQGSFQVYSLKMERDFWKQILDAGNLNRKERAEVSKKYYDAERQVRKLAFEAEIAEDHAKIEAYRQGSVERIQIAGESAHKIGERYGLESKEYKKALEEMTKLAQERAKQQQQLDEIALDREKAYQVSRVELERESLDTLEKLNQITAAEKLKRLRDLKEIEYQIELKAAQDKAEMRQADVVAYQQQLERIEALKQKHALDMKKIDGEMQVEAMKPWKTLTDAITSGFSTAIKGVIMGTQTLTQALRNMAQTVLLSMLDMGAKLLADQILKSIIGKALDKTVSLGKIVDNAAVAASAAFASTAAIPVVGPEMAPAAANAAFAGAMSWAGALASAASGFDIPRGINPVTQLHQEEMVLPADIANPLRSSLAGGGGMGGDTHVHFHGAVFDQKGMERWFRQNATVLAPALRSLARNFTPARG